MRSVESYHQNHTAAGTRTQRTAHNAQHTSGPQYLLLWEQAAIAVFKDALVVFLCPRHKRFVLEQKEHQRKVQRTHGGVAARAHAKPWVARVRQQLIVCEADGCIPALLRAAVEKER